MRVRIKSKPCKAPGCKWFVFADGYCNNHQYLREDYQRPAYIAPYSKNRSKVNRIYDKLAAAFKLERPYCELRIEGVCTGTTEGVHHKRGRGRWLLAVFTWLGACNACNGWCDRNHAKAQELGFLEDRLKKY